MRLAGRKCVETWLALALVAGSLGACADFRLPDLGLGGGPAEAPGAEAAPGVETAPGIAYRVALTGVPEKNLAAVLEGSARLFALRDRPPASLGALRRRAEGDLERLDTALRSEGFYAAQVRFRIDSTAAPAAVTLEVETGDRYLLADYEVRYEGTVAPEAARRPGLDDLGLYIGMPARAPQIVAAERALLDALGHRGHPLVRVLERKSLVDHDTGTMTVTLRVDAGPLARFGAVTLDGLEAVEADYVRGLLGWTEGDIYDREKVEAGRAALAATGLFASVVVTPGAATGPGGELPVAVRVSEAKHRSIGFGASYSTSEGVGGEVFWEHRNLLGRNEQLRLDLIAAEIEQGLKADIRKPRFLAPGQDLLGHVAVTRRVTDAFDERSVSGTIGLERALGDRWRASAGVSGEYSILDDPQGEARFRLFGLPLTGARDTTDSVLNPTRGTRLNLALTPYAGGDVDPLIFAVASAVASAYYALDSDRRFVLAGRAKLGAAAGAQTDDIPANKRFYAGGGGSVRGYAFQTVGPLDAENDPLGGRSLLELNVEARIRLSESIGIVPFIDGGSVFDSPYPDFEQPLRWAGGLGARYFTGIGPLRVDIAAPINGRDVDDGFQFYISLGQAF